MNLWTRRILFMALIAGLLWFQWKDPQNIGNLDFQSEASFLPGRWQAPQLAMEHTSTEITKLSEDQRSGLRITSFEVLNDNHESVNVCSVYDQIEMVLKAEGVAVNGERPALHLQKKCIQEGAFLQTAWLPPPLTSKRLRTLASEPNSSVTEYNPRPDQWPTQWVVERVRFYQSSAPQELKASVAQPKVFGW